VFSFSLSFFLCAKTNTLFTRAKFFFTKHTHDSLTARHRRAHSFSRC
jgi:hypothetical protein